MSETKEVDRRYSINVYYKYIKDTHLSEQITISATEALDMFLADCKSEPMTDGIRDKLEGIVRRTLKKYAGEPSTDLRENLRTYNNYDVRFMINLEQWQDGELVFHKNITNISPQRMLEWERFTDLYETEFVNPPSPTWKGRQA